ncbi:hypothetical protein WJX77_000201 [Trebouxia sp. C0004]
MFQALACLTYSANREAEANEAFVQHKRELRTKHTTPARTDGSGATRNSTFTLCKTGRSQGTMVFRGTFCSVRGSATAAASANKGLPVGVGSLDGSPFLPLLCTGFTCCAASAADATFLVAA